MRRWPHSGKLRRETLDNLINLFGDDAERVNHGLPPDCWTPLRERYANNDVRIHMHVLGGLEDFCAIFQYLRPKVKLPIGARKLWAYPGSVSSGHCDELDSSANYKQQPMFISIVYFLEPEERVGSAQLVVPALVWLQPLNYCLMFRAQLANHTSAITEPHALEMGDDPLASSDRLVGAHADEEYRELAGVCRCFDIQQGQLINEAIQSRAQIVGDFTNPDTPIKIGWERAYSRAIDVISSLRIEFRLDDLILAITPDSFLNPSEAINFTFCTPYLEARASERMRHDR